MEIVTSSVALVAVFLAKLGEGVIQKAGEDSWEKLKALYNAMCVKFKADQDDYAYQTLQRLEAQPLTQGKRIKIWLNIAVFPWTAMKLSIDRSLWQYKVKGEVIPKNGKLSF